MKERILCVDDEPHILEALRRELHREYDVSVAGDGREGLRLIADGPPFAVIVSDFMMPEMNGVQFLHEAAVMAPDSVRVMLTGYADMEIAMKAVNEGRIFQFLTKPCPPDRLSRAIRRGVEQYRLVHAERDLLEKTLRGSIDVLVGMLSMANPVSFSRSLRLARMAANVASAMKLPAAWSYEVAALLSQIGSITVPGDVLERMLAGETLDAKEQSMIDAIPTIGKKLIAPVPRLEAVAEMIGRSCLPCASHSSKRPTHPDTM